MKKKSELDSVPKSDNTSSEFDLLAENYISLHEKNIYVSGETPDYFSEYKISDVSSIVNKLKLNSSNILDFGSGVGNSLPYFKKYFPNSLINCADVSAKSLEKSESRFPGKGNYLFIDKDIPLPSLSQDLVFSACVFHHIPHEEHLYWLSEMFRVTKPGGSIFIYEHNPLNPVTVYAVNNCPLDENAKLIKGTDLSLQINRSGWVNAKISYKLFFPAFMSLLRPLERHLEWFGLGAQYRAFARKPL